MERGGAKRWRLARLTAVLLCLQVAIAEREFSGQALKRFTQDQATGKIYIGAVNRLYILNDDLTLLNTVSTGPVRDNPECTIFDDAREDRCLSLSDTDNHNKVLVLDKVNDQLLTCGSVLQGMCETRSLESGIVTQTYYTYNIQNVLAAATSSDEYETVAFVAPGPVCSDFGTASSEQQDVLYTALSLFYAIGRTQNRFTFLFSHQLSSSDYLEHTFDDELGTTKTESYFMEIDRFKTKNIARAGFSLNGFSYFIFLAEFDSNPVTSKIAQICQSDCNFYSYVEIPLECVSNDKSYNLVETAQVVRAGSRLAGELGVAEGEEVLVAVFREGSSVTAYGADSAICVYTMAYIRAKFTENIQACARGDTSITNDVFRSPYNGACTDQGSTDIGEDFCDTTRVNSPLSGVFPARDAPLLRLPATLVSALALHVVGPYTVAFLGTTQGVLIKVELEAGTTPYAEQTIEAGQTVRASMQLTRDNTHLMLLTTNKLHELAVSACGQASTCADCKALSDPYCGWCTLESKCSRREECTNYELTNRWTSQDGWCVTIDTITPQRHSLDSNSSSVTIVQVRTRTDLPAPVGDDSYSCVFGEMEERANSRDSLVTCNTPINPPTLPEGQDHRVVDFKIKSAEIGEPFLQSNFTFYNCGVHDRCSECAGAQWDCKWCVYDNRCRDSFTNCAQGSQSSGIEDTNRCPRIMHEREILVPSGVPWPISIDTRSLVAPLQGQDGYECVVHNREPATVVPAAREDNGNRIVCQSTSYTYERDAETEMPTIQVRWNGGYVVEDSDALTATVYKCGVMGRDCSQCLSLSQPASAYTKYDCRYCEARACSHTSECSAVLDTCPPPTISRVTPLSSTLEGGTLLTILGSNLGSRFNEVRGAVTLHDSPEANDAGAQCGDLEELYEVSTQIVCRVPEADGVKSVTIKLTLSNGILRHSQLFHYKDPSVTAISPVFGPMAGGTALTVEGQQLDTGSHDNLHVVVGGVTCQNPSISDTRITCMTGASSGESANQRVVVMYDDGIERAVSARYSYTPNPFVTSVAPLATFTSGGRMLTVKGEHFDVVARPQIVVTLNGEDRARDCGNITAAEMKCPTPCLLEDCSTLTVPDEEGSSRRKRQVQHTAEPEFGFIFDNVENYRSANASVHILLFPDPTFYEFPNGKKTYSVGSDSSLEIEGANMTLAASAEEVVVLVGQQPCPVRTLDINRLYCEPPDHGDDSASGSYPVTVDVGNLHFEIGELEYELKENSRANDYWIIIVGVGGGFLLAVIVAISIVYARKKSQADRQYKKLKMQLDTLESNVRNECKQAFAELQTEVSDFTSDISVIGIPYWDYKTYTFKVLFPSHGDHPVLHSSPDYKTNKFGSLEQGLHQFSQLLNSKQFMLIFIRTLEQQKNFSIRDKAVVASLLMIVLQDKMEYATEILRALLEELIDRSVEKKHPKLMLRRTESVVEKLLTNWLSIAMYGYVKKHCGQPLFMLYQAIKRQTEKGPVDGISSEARYSLSEDRLLREKMEPNTLTLKLVQDGQKEPLTCRVLDCDTITQAKQKALDAVYLNMPFSNRPSVHDVDLEWRTGKSGHLPLQDEDVTTEVLSGWKRVNTLAHYHVPDGAVMALVQKRHKTEGVRQVHGRIEITAGTAHSAIQPIVTMEEGQKVWHLVKHDDGVYVSRSQKVISEIFLTRLLATKGTLQQYIDDLFLTLLRVDHSVPPAVKWLFDLLDSAAGRHGITDPDVVHTWKSNSLPLRFWVNIIKNPDFVFDINKSHICDSCLSVIAQTFMDACSTTDHKLGKDSPSNKLLFAKDIPRYRGWVSKFYKGVQEMPPVTDQDINEIMTEMSLHYTADFNVSMALKELFRYAHQYNFELLENLDEDASARKLHLANMFEQVTAALDAGTLR